MAYVEKLRKRRSGDLLLSEKGIIVIPLDNRAAALKIEIINQCDTPSCAPRPRSNITGDISDFSVVITWDVEHPVEVRWTVTRFKDS